ncbi:MAG: hypothetical protein WAN36_04645 [Calditrichia bacterium]
MQYALDDWISYMKSKHISSITVGTNYIYFGTLDGGILRYHLFQNFWDYPFTTSNGLPSNRILDVVYDDQTGYLWAITAEDTCLFNPAMREWICKSENRFWNYTFPKPVQPTGDNSIAYNVFYPAEYLNVLPLYFANGLYTLTGDWKVLDENFSEFPISGFLKDHWERIWFAIDGLGIGIGNTYTQRMEVVPFGLSDINPRVVQFQYDDLWIGGMGRPQPDFDGITNWRNSDGSWHFYRARYISHLPSDNVTDIAVYGDSVWFATDYGLSLFDNRKNRWKNFSVKEGLYSNEVLDLTILGEKLYAGTVNGLNSIHMPTGIVKREKDETIHLATVYQTSPQGDTLWAATNQGILRKFPDGRWQAVKVGAAIQDLPTLAVKAFGSEIWFSSPEGVFWLDTKTGKWTSFPQLGMEIPGPFFDLAVNEISVWVSTSGGLLKFDRQRNYWIRFTEEDGLLDNQCYRLLLDGEFIWIACETGITQFYWNNPDRID